MLLLALGLLIAAYLAFGLRHSPRSALAAWLVCMILVPTWLGIHLGVSLQPLSIVGFTLVPCIAQQWKGPLRFGDWLMLGLGVSASVAWAFFSTPQSAWAAVFTQWGLAYLVGRSIGPAAGQAWVSKAIGICGTIVGSWAIIEFVFSAHVFENFAVALDTSGWRLIQTRAGFERSEGAFGHSIAMGGFIALSVPFIVASGTTTVRKVIMLSIAVAGTFLTFSRGALIAVLLALTVSLLLVSTPQAKKRAHARLISASVVALMLTAPLAISTLNSVSSDFTVSTEYRENLAASFLPDLNPLGIGDGVNFANDRQYYREFTSIDNAYALVGLQLGWIPVVFLLVGIIVVGVRLVRRRGGPADAAVIAQAVLLGSVALITQYGLAVFFVAGLSVGLGPSCPTSNLWSGVDSARDESGSGADNGHAPKVGKVPQVTGTDSDRGFGQ